LVEVLVDLVRAEPDAEAHVDVATMTSEGCQAGRQVGWVRLLPPPAQVGVRLRRVDIETVSVPCEIRDRGGPRLPRPRTAVEPLDDAQLHDHPHDFDVCYARGRWRATPRAHRVRGDYIVG